MIKITLEDLIKYLYKETSEQKTAAIHAALQTDWDLKEAYEKMAMSQRNLNKITYSPRSETVNNILEYAAKRQIVSSH